MNAKLPLLCTSALYTAIADQLRKRYSYNRREKNRVQLLTMMLFGEIYKLCDITLLIEIYLHYLLITPTYIGMTGLSWLELCLSSSKRSVDYMFGNRIRRPTHCRLRPHVAFFTQTQRFHRQCPLDIKAYFHKIPSKVSNPENGSFPF